MKITVIGATGGIGTQVVSQALKDGDEVTALVRDPARLSAPAHPRLDVVRTDVLDAGQLAPLVAGRDAVISTLGTRERGPTTICTDGARSLVAAATEVGLRRVLVVSAAGAFIEKSDDLVTRRAVKPLLGVVLRNTFADTRAMESIIRESGLDWTIVRPPRLTDGPHTGQYRTGYDGVRRGYTVARADVADCLLSLISRAETAGRTVTVAH
ncbi:NAD(P)-dependent oxidoreductase [Cryptosporangium aurantiacum]|uniref:Putative NADH-flavin reductase n=1 Tax=Cryptosporangium aurantiacum TaxID=134849 RepID=A0A1M7RE03_9ACTN|nr:NAD(P)H-binding protein [Cryptosporangium aurantiacum]SHN44547.1 Putative NADH-flavin reductase [Cryptosporangium aurantiacum]